MNLAGTRFHFGDNISLQNNCFFNLLYLMISNEALIIN